MANDNYFEAYWAGFKAGMYDKGSDGERDGSKVESIKAKAAKLVAASRGEFATDAQADVASLHQNTRAWKTGFNRGTEFAILWEAGHFGDVDQQIQGLDGMAELAADTGQVIAGAMNDPVGTAYNLGTGLAQAGAGMVLDFVGLEDTADDLDDLFDE